MSLRSAWSWAARVNDARRATGGGPIRGWKVALHVVAESDSLALKILQMCPPGTCEAVFAEVRRRQALGNWPDPSWPVSRMSTLRWVYDDLISGELDPRDLPIE